MELVTLADVHIGDVVLVCRCYDIAVSPCMSERLPHAPDVALSASDRNGSSVA